MRNNPLTTVEYVWLGGWKTPQNKGHSTPLGPPRYKLSSTDCCQLGPTSVYAQTAEQRLSRSQAFSTVRLVLQRRPSKIQLISVENFSTHGRERYFFRQQQLNESEFGQQWVNVSILYSCYSSWFHYDVCLTKTILAADISCTPLNTEWIVFSFRSKSAEGMICISPMTTKPVHFLKEGDERIKWSPRQPGCKLGHKMPGRIF